MATANDLSNQTHPVRTHRRIGMAVGLAVAGVAFLVLSSSTQPTSETSGGITALVPPLELPAFSLATAGSTPITRDSLKGRWTLVALGFISCPDVCPNTLYLLARAVRQSKASPGQAQVLFVSVDPERDTPQRLETYSKHFGEFVVGATGSHEQLLALTKPLGLFYERDNAGADPSQYNVQHSTTVLLVGPDAKVVALIRSGEIEASEITAALENLRESA